MVTYGQFSVQPGRGGTKYQNFKWRFLHRTHSGTRRAYAAPTPRDSLWDEAIHNLLNLNMGVVNEVGQVAASVAARRAALGQPPR